MKGLMQKDLYMIWKYGRSLLVVSAVFLAVSVVAPDNYFFVIYPVLFGGILPVTLISYEERDGWNSLCDTMPISRRTVVNERYVMTLLCFFAVAGLGLDYAIFSRSSSAPRVRRKSNAKPANMNRSKSNLPRVKTRCRMPMKNPNL